MKRCHFFYLLLFQIWLGLPHLMMNSRYAPCQGVFFCDKDKNPDVEAESIKKGALALAGRLFDGYSLLYLIFVSSYRSYVVAAYNDLVFHVYNDYGHET